VLRLFSVQDSDPAAYYYSTDYLSCRIKAKLRLELWNDDLSIPVQYGRQTRTVVTAASPSSASHCQIMHIMHRCHINRSEFPSHSLSPPEPSRPIVLNKAVFRCLLRPSWTIVMCLARLSTAPISYNMLYLHVSEASPSSLSPLPTILLSSPRFLTSPLCLTLTRLPHRPTSN
jgi:hypothetical protein